MYEREVVDGILVVNVRNLLSIRDFNHFIDPRTAVNTLFTQYRRVLVVRLGSSPFRSRFFVHGARTACFSNHSSSPVVFILAMEE